MVANPSLWVKFFQSAGVPPSTAASYAHIFYENRMELDMLTDLNKEYLREMGIMPMGDIIAILRHAKKVHDQNTREKILSGDRPAVATVSVSPIVPSAVTSNKILLSSVVTKKPNMDTVQLPKQARRVLPEHEGRYKITLPSGTTERSKEILAKKAMLYSDVDEKKGVFDRLQLSKNSTKSNRETKVTISGLGKIHSSIFSRLGGKGDDDMDDMIDDNAESFAGILKNSSKKVIKTIKKPVQVKHQKVVLVKKIPAKAATMIADEYENERMDTGQKLVSFSAEDEVLEIESRQVNARRIKSQAFDNKNVRARLGVVKGQKLPLSSKTNALLHRTQKTVKLKASPNRSTLNLKVKTSNMKSDEMLSAKSIKSRLNMKKGNATDVRKIADRIGRVAISARLGNGKEKKSTSSAASSSVFDRLGFNKK